MNFLNRAIKNIFRSVNKSIILLLTFFMIGNFVIIGLNISQATKNAKTAVIKKLNPVVKVSFDYQKWIQELQTSEDNEAFMKENPSTISKDILDSIISDERVVASDANFRLAASYLKDLKSYIPDEIKFQREEREGEEIFTPASNTIKLIGTYKSIPIDFRFNKANIIEGRELTLDDENNKNMVAVVSKEFAQYNNLTLGSKVSVSDITAQRILAFIMSDDTMSAGESPSELLNAGEEAISKYLYDNLNVDYSKTFGEFEIVGIYEVNRDRDYNQGMSNEEFYENRIYVPYSAAKLMNENALKELNQNTIIAQSEIIQTILTKEDYVRVNVLINDPLALESFVSDHQKDLNKYTSITFDNGSFNELSKPLDTLGGFAGFTVILVIFNAIIIIALVVALSIKMREYEIGILLSLGTSKLKVVLQLFIELALIGIVAFTLSLGSGSIISNAIGNKVLEFTEQKLNLDYSDNKNKDIFGFGNLFDNYDTQIESSDFKDNYKVELSLGSVIYLYLSAGVIISISVLIPSLGIMRYKPKKILNNEG